MIEKDTSKYSDFYAEMQKIEAERLRQVAELGVQAREDVINAARELLGEAAVNGGVILHQIFDQVEADREIAESGHTQFAAHVPIEFPRGTRLKHCADALEIAAKATGYTYIGTYNDEPIIGTPFTTATEAVQNRDL